MPDFFINRPIFAWVVALLISLVGLLAIPMLPVAQYPDIAPPVITIRTTYPGASAQITEEAVTAVIEKEINGAPGLLYMSATSDSNGMVEIAVTFQQGTDPDIAAVEVQNRLKIVESRLPESVRREGVFVEKSSNNIQAVISLSSDGELDGTELGELASARLIPELKRVKGVGRVELFGAEMSMRIWPDPEKLEALRLTPTDIVSAVASQSERIIIGDIGGAAVSKNAPINASVVASEELHTPEDFEAIALRTLPDGSSVKLGDVARPPGNGSRHIGVFQVQPGPFQGGLRRGVFRTGAGFLRHGLRVLPAAHGPLGNQGGIPFGLVLRVRQYGLRAVQGGLALVQRRLKRLRFNLEQQVSLFDVLPFLIKAFLNDAGDACAHLRLKEGLHAAGQIGGDGDFLPAHRRHRHFRLRHHHGVLRATVVPAGREERPRGKK